MIITLKNATQAVHRVRDTSTSNNAHFFVPCILLIFALWLGTHPYQGLIHDSRLYAVQALNAIFPERYARDLFLEFGSQDQFSAFSSIYKHVLRAFSLTQGTLFSTIIGEALWMVGLIFLVCSMVRDGNLRFLSIAMAIALPGEVVNSLRYGEAFLTPRIFAEALTMTAIGLTLRGRLLGAFLTLTIALTLHPLTTLPGCAILFIQQARGRPLWWLALGILFLASLVFAFAGAEPFVRLLQQYDAKWFSVVLQRNSFCFVSEWSLIQWLQVCLIFVLAGFVLTNEGVPHRGLLLITVLVALSALLTSYVGGDLFRNVLILNIQLWRALWIPALTVHILLAHILFSKLEHRDCSFSILFYFAIALSFLSGFVSVLYYASLPAAMGAWLLSYFRSNLGRTARIIVWAFLAWLIAGTMILLGWFSYTVFGLSALWRQNLYGIAISIAALLGVVLWTVPSLSKANFVRRLPKWAFALTVTVIAAYGWNQRSDWDKFVENGDAPASLVSLLPDALIYWDGDVKVPWFLLKRASFFSCEQGGGVLFSRRTAIAYEHRLTSLTPLNSLDFGKADFCLSTSIDENAPVTHATLKKVCKAEPELGALVLTKQAADDPGKTWTSAVSFEYTRRVHGALQQFATNRFYVYSCSDF